MMQLLDELRSFGIKILKKIPMVCCKVFEDNVGALELAKTPKLWPHTKHIAIQYHHFCNHVKKKVIQIFHMSMKEQVANIATKPLPCDQFQYLCQHLLGWTQ